MSLFFMLKAGNSTVPVVTVTGDDVSNTDVGPLEVGYRFNSDGTVDENVDASYSQVSSATDWIIPNNAASVTYSIKATTDLTVGAATRTGTIGSWETLDTTREWKMSRGSPGTAGWDITIEISDDGGTTTLDSGAYTMEVTVL